jgi:cell division septal protein FtsQ
MKKLYKIILLLTILIFLTTYSPNKVTFFNKNNNFFFKIQNIEITNNNKINKTDIINKLNHIYNKNILFISNDDISESLKTVNYLEKIEVKKKYPDTIVIRIYETKPVGILFKNNTKYIIDTVSNLITLNDNLVNNNFPNIFGKDAERDFINFFEQLKNNKFPRKEVKNYYYFQVDRWDVKLTNNQIIKFPSKKRKEAIQQSVKLLNHEDFENYKVIDLRIHGKIVVE